MKLGKDCINSKDLGAPNRIVVDEITSNGNSSESVGFCKSQAQL